MAAGDLILVVDDNESARYSKSRALRRGQFEVIEAGTGSDALNLIAERKPRLVVLDVQLPDIDGWEICRRIKADPQTSSILVLQVSATYVREEDTVRALEGGADGCLTEPIEPLVLIATVRALLRAREAEDALRDALLREQAARAAAEAANRLKDDFLATLSHELRSPLNAILTWVTLLRTEDLDEKHMVHAFEVIERNTRLQQKLIEDLLDVSRIISGKMRLEIGPVDLGEVLDAVLESHRPNAEAKGLVVRVDDVPEMPPVMADAARLQQILSNLISNAIKFTGKGGSVDISILRLDADVRIQVTDTGQGIEPEFLPFIFERFRQADSSTTRSASGLGLGLAIVRHLVELHHGSISVESKGRNQGASFTVLLPAGDPRSHRSPKALTTPKRLGRFETSNLHGVHTLIVDDDADAREAVAALLTNCGARVTAVGDVQSAMMALEHGPCDVVVSDVAMPIEDGYALIRALRGHGSPRVARLPSLALTAQASKEEQARLLEAGYDWHLAKPVDAPVLITAIADLAARGTNVSR